MMDRETKRRIAQSARRAYKEGPIILTKTPHFSREDIALTKKSHFCRQCSHLFEPDLDACPHCGTLVQVDAFGQEWQPYDKFECPYCHRSAYSTWKEDFAWGWFLLSPIYYVIYHFVFKSKGGKCSKCQEKLPKELLASLKNKYRSGPGQGSVPRAFFGPNVSNEIEFHDC